MTLLCRHFFVRLLVWVGLMAVIISAMSFVIGLVDILRSARNPEDLTILRVAQLDMYRVVSLIERVFILVVLFASCGLVVRMVKSNEVTACRASGLSMLRLAPAIAAVSLLLGGFHMALLNPIAAEAVGAFETSAAGTVQSTAKWLEPTTEGLWFRQSEQNGVRFIHAQRATGDPVLLIDVTTMTFDPGGDLREQATAATATLDGNEWVLHQVKMNAPSGGESERPSLRFVNTVDPDRVKNQALRILQLGFWDLSPSIQRAKADGLPYRWFEARWHNLVARPLMVATMVLIAFGCCAYTQPRDGSFLGLLVALCAGVSVFMLDVLCEAIGQAGHIRPVVAVWLPTITCLVSAVGLITVRELR